MAKQKTKSKKEEIISEDTQISSNVEKEEIVEESKDSSKKQENLFKRINWNKVLEYSMPAIVTMLIFVIAMAVKGVFPFGTNSIGVIDYDDGLVPAYTGLWDVLHGNMNVLVTWELGAGGSFISSGVLNSFLSPLCWLVALFPRNAVIYSVAFIVIIKLALMSTTAYICFKRFFPSINKYVLLMFTLMWTLSGWTFVHYTNVGWLSLMILVPLLLLSAKTLVEEGKIFWFVIILTYLLMLSYYITYMILVGVVVVATIYISVLAKEKKKVASNLFFAIIISILISFVAFIPSCLTSLQGHRFSGTAVGNQKMEMFTFFYSKWATLLMYAMPIYFYVRLIMTYKNDKKNVLFFIICLAVLGAGLIIEPINKMWHTGSYYSFPYRYSFLMVLLLIMGSLYYINKNIEGAILEEGESSKKPKWDAYVFVGFYAIIVSLLSLELSKTHPAGEMSIAQFSLYLMIFILSCLTIHFSLREKWKKLQLGKLTGGVLLVIFTIMQALSLNIAFMGHESINEERVTDIFNVEVSTLDKNYKIKDREFVYNHNFPYILDHSSMSTWIHISSEDQWVGYNKLGYQSVSTILSSSGGTLITDVLMGNKYILSRYELDSDYYTKLDTFDFKYIDIRDSSDVRDEEMNLYELNLDFDVTYTTNVDLSTLLENSDDWFYNHNLLYKSLYNQSADIITPTTYTTEDLGEGKYKLIVTAPANKMIYMSSKYNDTYHLTVDGKESLLANGLVDLGISSTGTIELEISVDKNDGSALEDSISFGAFDVETFKTIHNAKAENDSTLTFEGEKVKVNIDNTNDDKYLFIPYINLKNMVGQGNGKDVTVQSAFDTFIFVELEEGLNEVVVKYEPQYIKLCLIVTIAAAVVFVIFTILNKYFHLSNKKPIIWIGFIGGCVILLIVGFLVYLKPLFNFFVILLS